MLLALCEANQRVQWEHGCGCRGMGGAKSIGDEDRNKVSGSVDADATHADPWSPWT